MSRTIAMVATMTANSTQYQYSTVVPGPKR